MIAALTAIFIFTVSTLVVRIASTTMRLTGLPDNVARFQSLSALTGTGFTTKESELIVNYPIRRRVLMTLMIFGNLGLVSISATFIVTFVKSTESVDGAIFQAVLLIAALVLNFLFLTNKWVDHALCSNISVILSRTTSIGKAKFHILLNMGDDMAIAEHHFRSKDSRDVSAVFPDGIDLKLIAIRGENTRHLLASGEEGQAHPNETLICYGSEDMHRQFAERLRPESVIVGHETSQV